MLGVRPTLSGVAARSYRGVPGKKRGDYAASGTALALSSARLRRASIVRSARSATRSRPPTRSGVRAYSFFSGPNSLSTLRHYMKAGALEAPESLDALIAAESGR
jgi:hypothetical protein